MKFFKCVNPEEQIPAWYGMCYNDFWKRQIVTAPIPFNIFIRWTFPVAMRLKYWVKVGSFNWVDKCVLEARIESEHHGYRQGLTIAARAYKDAVSDIIDKFVQNTDFSEFAKSLRELKDKDILE